LIITAVILYGFRKFDFLDIGALYVAIPFALFLFAGSFITVRSVTLIPEGMRVSYYAGPERLVSWEDVKKASRTVRNDVPGENIVLRLVPRRGRSVTITEKISDWDQLYEVVAKRLPIEVREAQGMWANWG
jgi:hypothetical protein